MPMLELTIDAFREGAKPTDRTESAQSIDLAVMAARRGDRAAFAQLHEQFAPMVHGIILARASTVDVADLVQQTFLEALEKVHMLREPAAFGGWLAAIARNLAVNSRRERVRVRFQHTAVIPEARNATTVDSQDAEDILRTIRSLPEAYAETLVLRLVEGMTGPQIAAGTGLTEGSVRVNLHRGMEMLRKKLEKCHEV